MGVFQFTNSRLLNVTLWVILCAVAVGFRFGTPTYFTVLDNTVKIDNIDKAVKLQDSSSIGNILLNKEISTIKRDQEEMGTDIKDIQKTMVSKEDFREFKSDLKIWIDKQK